MCDPFACQRHDQRLDFTGQLLQRTPGALGQQLGLVVIDRA
jgi:hypothetical protein